MIVLIVNVLTAVLGGLMASGIKLTLDQNMNDVFTALSPAELGQFLHSIDDLPKLAELVDPGRSRYDFDFAYYYSHHGCAEDRLFNMNRIQTILSDYRLTYRDRAVLLHHDCIANWPQLLTVPENDLKFLLNRIPEANPLLYYQNYENDSLFGSDNWNELLNISPERLRLLIAQAHLSRNSLNCNMRRAIETLVLEARLSMKMHVQSSHFGLITHRIAEMCYDETEFEPNRDNCTNFLLHALDNSSPAELTNFDIVHWLFNAAAIVLIDRKRFSEFASLFQKIRSRIKNTCFNSVLVDFSKRFEAIIKDIINQEYIEDDFWISEFKNIFYHGKKDNTITLNPSSYPIIEAPDTFYIAIELYNWLKESFNYGFSVSPHVFATAFNILESELNRGRPKNPHHVLDNLFKDFDHMTPELFTNFIGNNFNTVSPDEKIIQSFRNASKVFGSKARKTLLNAYKSILPYDFRLSYMRKICFANSGEMNDYDDYTMFIAISDSIRPDATFFEDVYSAFLHKNVFFYPFNVVFQGSGFMNSLMKSSSNLPSVIQHVWNLFESGLGNFVSIFGADESENDGLVVFYGLPNPWTNPNVVFFIGAIMTVAVLYGIKLKGWAFDRQIFTEMFELSSLVDFDLHSENHFIHLHLYREVKGMFGEIRTDPIKNSIDKLSDMRKELSNSERRLLARLQYDYLKFNTDDEQFGFDDEFTIWDGQMFAIVDIYSRLPGEPLKSYIDRLMRLEFNLNMNRSAFAGKLLDMGKKMRVNRAELAKRMAKMQLFSLFLGLEPLTRILTADEAYNSIFC